MSPPVPLASTLVIRDNINEAFKTYVNSKPTFQPLVLLSMLSSIAGLCGTLVTSGDPAIFTDHNLSEPVFIVRQEYNSLNDLDKSVTAPVGFNVCRDFCKKVQIIRDAGNAQKRGAADIAAALADVKPKPRPRKAVKSKAVIDDKDDDEIEIIGDVDVTMGASDGPITAASGPDAMKIDNLFNGEVEAKVATKDKGKKRAASKFPFKRAETVRIPYASVPGMDTKNRIFFKATAIENGQVASSSNKRARIDPSSATDLARPSASSRSIKDFITQRTRTVLDKPMPGEPTLDYYCTTELDLRNRVITVLQHMDLELKLFEVVNAEYETVADLLKDYEEIEAFLA
ncbi:uncharacterized protein LACBIDRAFT_335112 [Laccaria bicolor S238N-H82]|uniref:Predicted protein n=1 Tax=Laccaria bicolor (strain S238N-H82 / ATCC MYA-4686) TaxID=486041 RepID=B0E1E4_LACBS|nr:uncharacterized protein LACBIDRAFT_335112 [Laccaria bicolor S238N-H82]EDQ99351.1 predicted protein [Laccaria bicolor S238N-H82]|eukprot:XP_001889997.1 predicted protein [Laccaria bicolor S238N-H82]